MFAIKFRGWIMEQNEARILALEKRLNSLNVHFFEMERRIKALEQNLHAKRSTVHIAHTAPSHKQEPSKASTNNRYLSRAIHKAKRDYERKHG